MTPDKQPTSHSPLIAPHGWNAPGEPVVVYDGELIGFKHGSRQGRVELTFGAKPSLEWAIEPYEKDYYLALDDTVEVTAVGRQPIIAFTANSRDSHGGWINSTHLGNENVLLQRLVAQWVNLPLSAANAAIGEQVGEGTRFWRGRWSIDVDGWTVTIDQRPDLSDVLRTATEQRLLRSDSCHGTQAHE